MTGFTGMTRLIEVMVFTLLVFGSVAAQTEQSPWETLAPESAGFSVSMPGKAVETITTKPSFTLHSFSVTMGRATFVASYTDYQPAKLDPATALTANRDKFNKSLQATLITSREITLDGRTGIEFTSETPAADVKSQLFLIGNRMFQTATFVFRDVDETRNVNRFFESLQFTTKSAALFNNTFQRARRTRIQPSWHTSGEIS